MIDVNVFSLLERVGSPLTPSTLKVLCCDVFGDENWRECNRQIISGIESGAISLDSDLRLTNELAKESET